VADYYPFDPHPRQPHPLPPPGTCDSQFHVFGSPERYPVRPGAGYEMPTATVDEALKMHRTLGIDRGVIVQPTTYGTDHRALLDALAHAGSGYRGCAIAAVLTAADEPSIATLHDAGVRGARFNFLRQLNLMPSAEGFARAVARMRELGWYAKVQPGPDGILDSVELFEDVDIPLVIDHMGRPVGETADGPTVRKVVELLQRGNVWVMLSNGHKLSRTGYPWDDVMSIARAYIEAAPDRVIWGSDWPHPLSTEPPPNDADLLELLYRYTPDEDERRRVLIDNPAALFGFVE
jgi:predicted TIM-barrel fold metal-dependent hydrolase